MDKKQGIIKILIVIICIILLFTLTGCKADNNEDNQIKNETSNNDNSQNQEIINIDRTVDFDGDYAVVSETINFETTNYIINKDFKVLSSYKGNAECIDGYILIEDEENKNIMNIKDCSGNVVFSYNKEKDYNKVKLVSNGCVIIEKQTDTYNTSLRQTGIYDLKERKYILEPSEKYNNIYEYGDNMLTLENKKTFFNLVTKKIVEYSEEITREFKDGYSIDTYSDKNSQDYLKIFDMEGNIKLIKSLLKSVNNIKESSNGMLVDGQMRVETENYREQITGTNIQLFDFEKETVKDLSDQFIMLENQPLFTKNGYALIIFQNQGGATYYTVIDREGNKLFEPQKRNNEASFGAKSNGESRIVKSENLYENDYFVVEDDGVSKIIDKNNNEILVAEENEIFEGITNNVVKVHWEKTGYHEQYYYKDLQGNKISIVKEK